MNNLFDFATSELSQDAVICWCVNWYNEKESKLYPLAASDGHNPTKESRYRFRPNQQESLDGIPFC